MAGRSSTQRRDDALRRLQSEPNVWVATASPDGVPHLVPLSLAWDGSMFVLATETTTPTARNCQSTGRARLALDSADDVVLVDAEAEVVALEAAPADLVDLFVQRAGWDPQPERGSWALLLLRPRTVRAWNSVAEISGRTIMRNGEWTT